MLSHGTRILAVIAVVVPLVSARRTSNAKLKCKLSICLKPIRCTLRLQAILEPPLLLDARVNCDLDPVCVLLPTIRGHKQVVHFVKPPLLLSADRCARRAGRCRMNCRQREMMVHDAKPQRSHRGINRGVRAATEGALVV